MSEIKIKHSYNAGDLISVLPSLRQLWIDTNKKVVIYQRLDLPAYYYDYANIIIKDANGNSVCMNDDIFRRLFPLIRWQEYIEDFKIWNGEQVDYDFDLTRDSKLIPMPSGEIYSWSWTLFPEMTTNLSEDWIKLHSNESKELFRYKDRTFIKDEKIIINRTSRYINPYITYFFIKNIHAYQFKFIFSGTKAEHEHFCKQWNLELDFLETDNFYDLARIISLCKFGIYNQSLHFHIAQSMHKPRILELCPQFPNTFNHGKNGYAFYHQKSFEHFFNKLINK